MHRVRKEKNQMETYEKFSIIQLEINSNGFMDTRSLSPFPKFDRIQYLQLLKT